MLNELEQLRIIKVALSDRERLARKQKAHPMESVAKGWEKELKDIEEVQRSIHQQITDIEIKATVESLPVAD